MTKNPKVSRKTLLSIVEEVQKRSCLWNPDDKYHSNRGRVAVAWEEVTATLNLPESLIKAKWKIMRDLFKREMKRCKVNSSGEYRYTGKWRHFKLMWFLHKPREERLIHNDATEDSCSSSEQDTRSIKKEDDTNMDESQLNNASFEKSNLNIDYQPDLDPLPIDRRQLSEDDYELMFLKSLVPYFRGLDPVRKLRIRNMIQDIMINEINAQGGVNSTH